MTFEKVVHYIKYNQELKNLVLNSRDYDEAFGEGYPGVVMIYGVVIKKDPKIRRGFLKPVRLK